MTQSLPILADLRNALDAAILETDGPAKLARLTAVLNDTRLASYRPGPRVALAELREELDSIDATEAAFYDALANGDEPPPGALNDLVERRDAIQSEIDARRGGR